MGLRVKLLIVIGVFLLSSLGSSRAKSPTVEVVGAIHCTNCIKNGSSSGNSSLGYEVLITCNANEMRARGNGGVDERGKFNVALSAETPADSGGADGCYAKLQSRSGAPCHIQAALTASVKILSNSAVNITRPSTTVIKFSPITCQSAFFWHFPNLTFFGSPPPSPPEYTPPPTPPVAFPVQSPLPPPEKSAPPPPEPSYDPPAPSLSPPVAEAPSPPPALPPSQPPPTSQNPKSPRIGSPSPTPQAPPPPRSSPVYRRRSPPPLLAAAPPLSGPIQSPIQTPNPTPPPTVIAPTPPTPASSDPPAPTPAAGISITPRRRRPSPIPKAPPIPRLPVTPSVPREYFNPPKSRSKPPRFV